MRAARDEGLIVRWTDPVAASVRLVCFGRSGSGAAQWAPWAQTLPADIAVVGVRFPGRESRRQAPLTDMRDVIDEAVGGLASLRDKPLVLFGQCSGAVIAYEVCRELERRGARPEHLLVAAQGPPALLSSADLPRLETTEEVRDHLRAIGGTDERLLGRDVLVAQIASTLRADYEVLRNWTYRPEPRLSVPITAFIGDADEWLTVEIVRGWARETTAGADTVVVPGTHSLQESWLDLAAAVALRLGPDDPSRKASEK